MINFKMQPASYFLQDIHPDLYRVDDLHDEVGGYVAVVILKSYRFKGAAFALVVLVFVLLK